MYITAQPPSPRLRNDLYCVEWDVKLYYTVHSVFCLAALAGVWLRAEVSDTSASLLQHTSYAVVTTRTRFQFDGHSTARSLRSRWRDRHCRVCLA